uniref:Peptidase aspartic putative domain-containing protein n=1 Tax=Plectus sambesii TaxID=2011161 RepID=A0A914UQF9_9BILA
MMAGIFWLQIGRERKLLTSYVKESGDRDYKLDRASPDLLKIAHKKKQEALVDTGRLRTSADRLQGYVERLAKFVAELNLDEEGQKEEQKKFATVIDGDEGALALIEHAHRVIDTLAEYVVSFEHLERAQLLLAAEALGNPQLAPMTLMNHPIVPIRSNTQLPKLELCQFDGTITDWQQFWETFKVTVDDEPLPSVQKLSYLISTLRGEARQVAVGYAVTAANYPVLVGLLKEKYGNQDMIRERLHAELQELQRAGEQLTEARNVIQQIERICRQLEALGDSTEGKQIEVAIQSKLPRWILRSVHQEKDKDALWTIQKLCKHVETTLRLEEKVAIPHKDVKKPTNVSAAEYNTATGTFAVSAQRTERKTGCSFCNGDHWTNECTITVTRESRQQKAAELRLCFRCLRTGHNANRCNYHRPCFSCKQDNHSALCPNKGEYQGPQKMGQNRSDGGQQEKWRKDAQRRGGGGPQKVMAITEAEEEVLVPQGGPAHAVHVTINNGGNNPSSEADIQSPRHEVLLLSREVVLSNPAYPELKQKTMAFFDVGSQLSFITTDLAQKLELQSNNHEKLSISTFAAEHPTTISSHSYAIDLKHMDGSLRMKVSALTKLTDWITVPTEHRMASEAMSLQGRQATPGILIGADYFWDLVDAGEVRKLPSGFNQIGSKVGPMLCGRGHITSMMAIQKHQEDKSTLDDTIEQFWKLEAIGIKDDPDVDDDDIALQQFQKNVCRKEGRYFVRWPWREEQPDLPSNYFTCVGRLQSTLKRLREHPEEMLHRYDAILQEQLIKGVIEPVENIEEHGGLVHYLPHHPVLTPDKATTKMRIVYDASAKAKRGAKSLNDCLYRGPLLTSDLCGMLLRFRTYNIAIVADVEKAFLQLGLEEKDRDAVRFLWLKDVAKPWSADNMQVYRFCRVPFGVVSSPFLLAATIHHHLQNHDLPQLETKVAQEITNNIYADNILMAATTTEEARKKCREAKVLFGDALMNLREFVSNDQLVNKEFADAGQKEDVKFLGVPWNTRRDTITLALPVIAQRSSTTKRHVLQAIASVFDPLGLLAPAIVPAKRFFQELWQKPYNWDQQLSVDDENRWKNLAQSFSDKQLKQPRKVYDSKHEGRLTLHTFVDASAIAYAAAIYLRQELKGGVIVTLLYAKSRLCPIKGMTIPRLELMAAVIGSRMTKFIVEQIQKPVQEITLWSDSKCVLGWIHSKSGMLPKFVANRVHEIHNLKMTNFRYVPTKENPADLGSRGCTADELKDNHLWWTGPPWLTEDQQKWPPSPIITPDELEEEVEENFQQDTQLMTSILLEPPVTIIDPERCSSWQSLRIIMAMVLWLLKVKILDKVCTPPTNFWKRLQRGKNGRRSAEMMSLAEEELIRQAQRSHPPEHGEVEGLGLQKDGRGLLVCTKPPTRTWRS